MAQITERIVAGEAGPGDVELLKNVATQMQNRCLCALGEFATMSVISSIQEFSGDFEAMVIPKAATPEGASPKGATPEAHAEGTGPDVHTHGSASDNRTAGTTHPAGRS